MAADEVSFPAPRSARNFIDPWLVVRLKTATLKTATFDV